MPLMSTIGDRIRVARRRKHLSQKELAELCGWSFQAARISNYERGKREPRSENLEVLAKALDVSIEWFYRELPRSGFTVHESRPSYAQSRYTPVINWDKIHFYLNRRSYPADTTEFVATHHRIGDRSFALTVQGDSMTSSQGVTFPEGCHIIIDPDAVAEVGDFVVAESGRDDVTFKQLIQDGGKYFLKPLNSRYPLVEIASLDAIIGVVRTMVQEFK